MKKESVVFSALSLVLTTLLSTSAFSAVWETQRDWQSADEEGYSAWVKSEQVRRDIFHSKTSPYHGIRVDCADVAYAFRAIYAFENGLPYKVKNPAFRRGGKAPRYLSNELRTWDKYSSANERVVRFINYIGINLGTETLSINDSYPIALDKITSADMFLFKLVRANPIRHAYILKDVTPVGNFDVIYSTQALKKDKQPLELKKDFELKHAPTINHWGFKRFISPEYFESRPLEEAADFNREQYTLAKELGEKKFFKEVKKRLAEVTEDPSEMITRKLKALCDQVQDRVAAVQAGVDYAAKINQRCMNYQEYDAYSTPNRDGGIRSSYDDLKYLWQEDEASMTDARERARLENLFEKGSETGYCQVKLAGGKVLSFKQAVEAIAEMKASFHPNDKLENRWGLGNASATRCQAFYE